MGKPTPVSYTHLDVYKRQLCNQAKNLYHPRFLRTVRECDGARTRDPGMRAVGTPRETNDAVKNGAGANNL